MRYLVRLGVLIGASLTINACSLGGLVDGAERSSETRDPSIIRTRQGALSAYHGAHMLFARALSFYGASGTGSTLSVNEGVILVSGLLTDELRASNMSASFPTDEDAVYDSRSGNGGSKSSSVYQGLHKVRSMAQEGRGLVRDYLGATEWRDLYAHLYAIEAYADILLADLYCSGVPLSRVTYLGDYTLTAGFTTKQVYQNALTLFDSAEVYIQDSSGLLHFVNVGRGRALIAVGEYARAADAVQNVPDSYRYDISYSSSFSKQVPRPNVFVIADGDGGTGIRFVSDNDPRASLPALYDLAAPLTLASGIEARLIEVEATIHADTGDWLAGLNTLRTTCVAQLECQAPAPPGIGGVANLPPLEDSTQGLPQAAQFDKRIDMLFRERAYWLFLTGHRQGDLRRLVRQYGRNDQLTYPSGSWGTQGFTIYGTHTNIAVPDEELRNPQYHGCLTREA